MVIEIEMGRDTGPMVKLLTDLGEKDMAEAVVKLVPVLVVQVVLVKILVASFNHSHSLETRISCSHPTVVVVAVVTALKLSN